MSSVPYLKQLLEDLLPIFNVKSKAALAKILGVKSSNTIEKWKNEKGMKTSTNDEVLAASGIDLIASAGKANWLEIPDLETFKQLQNQRIKKHNEDKINAMISPALIAGDADSILANAAKKGYRAGHKNIVFYGLKDGAGDKLHVSDASTAEMQPDLNRYIAPMSLAAWPVFDPNQLYGIQRAGDKRFIQSSVVQIDDKIWIEVKDNPAGEMLGLQDIAAIYPLGKLSRE